MEVNQKRAEAASASLDFNKGLNTVHVTSDLECFPDRNAAVNHARTLEDQSIDVFDRNGDDVELDMDLSADTSGEAYTDPDYDLAKAKAEGGAGDAAFDHNPPVDPPAPIPSTTPVIEQASVMDTLKGKIDPVVINPDQVTQKGVLAEPAGAATQELQKVETAGTQTTVVVEPGKAAVLAEPVLTAVQKRAKTIADKKAAADAKAEEVK